jgi:flavin-dependent dehydrogenase
VTPTIHNIAALLHPLEDFYASAGAAAPRIEPIDGELMPQPYRSLLVHRNDMTPTLEQHFGKRIHLRRLDVRQTADSFYRQVVLETDGDNRPVEFGAIRIYLARFSDAARAEILGCRTPLGTILHDFHIAHYSRPRAFFSLTSDRTIEHALGLTGTHTLYGRHNVLYNDRDEVLAEVVEILPVLPSPASHTEGSPVIQPSSRFDAIIIGGGPGGSSAAAALAMKGRRVVVLEKEKFPRYKIGESLIPYCYFPLERIGMIPKLQRSGFVKKYSVQFVSTEGKVSQPFYFNQHTDHPCAQTWQVIRDEFDQMLIDNAVEKGAEVRMQTQVREIIWEGDRAVGVRGIDSTGEPFELRAPVVLDASGRDGFTMNRHGWKVMDPSLKKVAMWSYWKGAMRDPGLDEGATTVAFVPDKGWFWYIPQHGDVVSVGIVADKEYLYRDGKDPEKILAREVNDQPWIKVHCEVGTKIAPVKVTGDYSYRSRYCAADGLVLVGDAFAFLDPVFSSGVFLALYSGVIAADHVDAALAAGDTSAERFTEYGDQMRHALEAMRRLVYAFYDQNFSWAKLFKKYPHLKADATDCLIGNLDKDFDPLFNAVAEFASVPAPLPHGRPKINHELAR